MTTPHKELLIQARNALLYVVSRNFDMAQTADPVGNTIEALQAAIDQPEQALTFYANDEFIAEFRKGGEGSMVVHTVSGGTFNTPLYTHPAPTKPLTDEQIGAAITAWFDGDHQQTFLKRMRNAIEAAHNIGPK